MGIPAPDEKTDFSRHFQSDQNTFTLQSHHFWKPRPQRSLSICSNSWSEKSEPSSSTISTPFVAFDIEIMSVLTANTQILCREVYPRDQQQYPSSNYGRRLFPGRTAGPPRRNRDFKRVSRREWRVEAFWPESRPTVVEMEAINDSDHLDQILLNAQNLSQPILIDWMAEWCRKCIYLKPKLEKLAAEYDTKVKFYFVDVNKVSQSLVKRGNISKMPTIQIWKDGEMKAEVIGGHKAWLVIEEVRAMIQNFL